MRFANNGRSLWAALAVTVTAAAVPAWAGSKERIDLVEFGRVVQLPDEPARVTTHEEELVRGADGWDAVRGPDGQYSIGIEWDAPRDVSEVCIEFRHAIANREQIRVQYWKDNDAESRPGGERKKENHTKGKWLTPQTDWWAGDRDVSFAFGPRDRETSAKDQPGARFRCTSRIRFLCGKQDLPPVRYLRAYGPGTVATDTFDIRFDDKGQLAPPVTAEVVNGYTIAADDKTTMDSAVIREKAGSLQIRYFRNDESSPNRTEVTLSPVDQPLQRVKFLPAAAAQKGLLQIASAGVVVEKRGRPSSSTRRAE